MGGGLWNCHAPFHPNPKFLDETLMVTMCTQLIFPKPSSSGIFACTNVPCTKIIIIIIIIIMQDFINYNWDAVAICQTHQVLS